MDPVLMARKLALRHVAQDADRGISEDSIRTGWHCSGRSHEHWKDAADGFGGYEVKVQSTKVVVEEVCGIKGRWVFSLHELYVECQSGQVALL